MEVFDVSKSAEKEEETESVKDDLEMTNILKTKDKVIFIELLLLPWISHKEMRTTNFPFLYEDRCQSWVSNDR